MSRKRWRRPYWRSGIPRGYRPIGDDDGSPIGEDFRASLEAFARVTEETFKNWSEILREYAEEMNARMIRASILYQYAQRRQTTGSRPDIIDLEPGQWSRVFPEVRCLSSRPLSLPAGRSDSQTEEA